MFMVFVLFPGVLFGPPLLTCFLMMKFSKNKKKCVTCTKIQSITYKCQAKHSHSKICRFLYLFLQLDIVIPMWLVQVRNRCQSSSLVTAFSLTVKLRMPSVLWNSCQKVFVSAISWILGKWKLIVLVKSFVAIKSNRLKPVY